MATFHELAKENNGSPLKLEDSTHMVVGWDVRSGFARRRAEAYFGKRADAVKFYDALESHDKTGDAEVILGDVKSKTLLISSWIVLHTSKARDEAVA